jgi:predicted membrane metal-binding protein
VLLTVAALYVVVRLLFRRHSRTLATTTALALTVSLWHIHFSHYGIRVILMPLIYCGLFAALWLGLGDGRAAYGSARW